MWSEVTLLNPVYDPFQYCVVEHQDWSGYLWKPSFSPQCGSLLDRPVLQPERRRVCLRWKVFHVLIPAWTLFWRVMWTTCFLCKQRLTILSVRYMELFWESLLHVIPCVPSSCTLRVWELDLPNRKIRPTECQTGQLKRVVKCIEVNWQHTCIHFEKKINVLVALYY